ncbi:MAG: hypothetical protein ABIR37_01305 [Candidatus Saccharimonadales bacterium]
MVAKFTAVGYSEITIWESDVPVKIGTKVVINHDAARRTATYGQVELDGGKNRKILKRALPIITLEEIGWYHPRT